MLRHFSPESILAWSRERPLETVIRALAIRDHGESQSWADLPPAPCGKGRVPGSVEGGLMTPALSAERALVSRPRTCSEARQTFVRRRSPYFIFTFSLSGVRQAI